jgi:AbiTii
MLMATIVEKLQQAALDKNTPVNDLLRRVKFAAAKLSLGSVEKWVEQELNGYDSAPPDYRRVHGTPFALNPVRGWEPIGGYIEPLSTRTIGEPVSSLEALLAMPKSKGTLQISYSDKVRESLDQSNGVRGWNYCLRVSPSELERILDRVRTLVLDWSLNLEKTGIMGSEESFDRAEKEIAQAAGTTINIGHIGSLVGNLGHGNVSGHITVSDLKTEQIGSIIPQLRAHRDELVAAGVDGGTLDDRLNALEKALANPQSDHGFLKSLIADLRNCLSGAAGSLVASGALNILNTMLGTGVPPS